MYSLIIHTYFSTLSQILFVLPLLCDLSLLRLLLALCLLHLAVGHPHGVVAVGGLERAGGVVGLLQGLGGVHGTWGNWGSVSCLRQGFGRL